jgi:hypothetical protein
MLENNIFGSKPASRDVEEVPGKTHTSSWDTIISDNLFVKRICYFPSLILVVILASRNKIDGTDLDASQSNLMVLSSQFEIKSCCIRLVNSCNSVFIFGNWERFSN